MDEKPRLASDPLEWIRDTRKEADGIGEGREDHLRGERLKGVFP